MTKNTTINDIKNVRANNHLRLIDHIKIKGKNRYTIHTHVRAYAYI